MYLGSNSTSTRGVQAGEPGQVRPETGKSEEMGEHPGVP